MPYSFNLFIIIPLFVFGMFIYSYLNTVIYSVPNKPPLFAGTKCPACGRSIIKVPVFGQVWRLLRQGGRSGLCGGTQRTASPTKSSAESPTALPEAFDKNDTCRYCSGPRSILIELIGGIFAVACIYNQGLSFKAVLLFAFLGVLSVVAVVDIDTMEIPNGFVIFALALGVISIFVFPELNFISRIIGFFSVSLPLFIIAFIIPGAFGGGDIKLMAACGLFLGWKLSFISLLFGVLSGGLYGIYLLLSKKKGGREHFAFGPFLCVGMAAAWFFGEALIGWYLGMFL